MRGVAIPLCTGTASLIAGIVTPLILPASLPDWLRFGLLALAAALYLIAATLWFARRGAAAVPREVV